MQINRGPIHLILNEGESNPDDIIMTPQHLSHIRWWLYDVPTTEPEISLPPVIEQLVDYQKEELILPKHRFCHRRSPWRQRGEALGTDLQ